MKLKCNRSVTYSDERSLRSVLQIKDNINSRNSPVTLKTEMQQLYRQLRARRVLLQIKNNYIENQKGAIAIDFVQR